MWFVDISAQRRASLRKSAPVLRRPCSHRLVWLMAPSVCSSFLPTSLSWPQETVDHKQILEHLRG